MNALLFTVLLTAPPEAAAATVNGAAIPLAEVDRFVTAYRLGGALPTSELRSLREIILEGLIDDELILQYVNKHGPPTDAITLEAAFQEMKKRMKKPDQTFEGVLQARGLTETGFRGMMDLNERFAKMVAAKTTSQQYRAYFEANREVFDGATVTAAHIFTPVPEGAAESQWAAATRRLSTLRKDILDGHITFSAAAKRFGLDPTAASGGSLGTLTRRDPRAEEAVLRTAFALKVNGVSEPVRSTHGVHLVTITAKSPGTPVTFEKAIERVHEEHAAQARQNLAEQLRAKATIKITLP